MASLGEALSVQVTLFALMLLGILFRRRGIIDEVFSAGLTEVILRLILPCSILDSFRMSLTAELLEQTGVIFVLSAGIQLLCWVLAMVLFRRQPEDRRPVLQYATLCSNAGFLGTGIAGELFGGLGLLLTSVYLIPQRVAMWTVGLTFFRSRGERTQWGKLLRHPCIVAVFLGLGLLITPWEPPAPLLRTITGLGSCNLPMSMFLIGSLISESPWKYFRDRAALCFSAVRLGLIPLLVALLCGLAGTGETVRGIAVILSAMPAGGTTAIVAAKEGRGAEFAAGCVTVSTLLSMAAIPLWCEILRML